MRDTVYCLCDVAGRAAIAQSIAKMGADLQIYGPGYRLYFVRRGRIVIVLLCGGDKASQHRDIKNAKELAKTLED